MDPDKVCDANLHCDYDYSQVVANVAGGNEKFMDFGVGFEDGLPPDGVRFSTLDVGEGVLGLLLVEVKVLLLLEGQFLGQQEDVVIAWEPLHFEP